LTAGFMSKFYMLQAAIHTGKQMWLVIFAVLCAAISAYYYFRVIQAMYFKDSNADSVPVETSSVNTAFKVLLIVTAVLIIAIGLFPSLITDWLYF
ncbi:MAG TPA: NADH-quinone oxidoreductase subunit N, partial [Ferruginibacter sp.]|nr:NADH-quinone oxidoreductase subunit N [Ferruginibacter sp.]